MCKKLQRDPVEGDTTSQANTETLSRVNKGKGTEVAASNVSPA